MAKNQTVSPDLITMHTFSYTPSRVLTTGVQLHVFTHLAEGKNTIEKIAAAEKASPRGIRMLLDALVGMELLTKSKDRYGLTPVAERYLVRTSPDYMGEMMETDALWEGWTHLADVIRTGKPVQRVESQEQAEQFFPALVRGLHIMNREPAKRTAEALLGNNRKAAIHALDVACGSGVWGIAVLEANPQARVTFQDYPGVLDVTREYTKRHSVADRADYLSGNLRDVDFGENRFDIALLGNIVHSEGEQSSRDLLRRLHRAMKPGGRVVIIDMVPNDERSGPPFALNFALNMLLHTEEGDTYTLAEYTDWLRGAGYARVETVDIENRESPLVVGVKD